MEQGELPLEPFSVMEKCIICGKQGISGEDMHRLVPWDSKDKEIQRIKGKYLGWWVCKTVECVQQVLKEGFSSFRGTGGWD